MVESTTADMGPPAENPTGQGTTAGPEEAKEEVAPHTQERVESVSHSQREESGAMPQNLHTSSRVIVQTENGLVNKDAVREVMQANIPPDAPAVKSISFNQS